MTKFRRIRFATAASIAAGLVFFSSAGQLPGITGLGRHGGSGEGGYADRPMSIVGFSGRETVPGEEEIKVMIDEVVYQTLGKDGWNALCKAGDRVVLKVNLVGPHRGSEGEKGRGIITDPRIVRIVAEEIRSVIGHGGSADLMVTDALFYADSDPSLKREKTSFYYSGYDNDGDGILDGTSGARLVNCDSYRRDRRFLTEVEEPTLGKVQVWFPEFMRTREQAAGTGEYCDVLIGLPVFKSHGFVGITGALKLYYGLRSLESDKGDGGRYNHSGYGWGTGNKQLLLEYLCAENKARPCDFALLDALTANRKGPLNLSEINIGKQTDFFLSNAILGSVDPVALDTIETLLGGYDPESIKLLSTAATNGLGEDTPSRIYIPGGEAFGQHKRFLARTYPCAAGKEGRTFRSWPLEDKWGGARILPDITPPVVTRFEIENSGVKGSVFGYSASDGGKISSGLSRIDLTVDGEFFTCLHNPPDDGRLAADLSSFSGRKIVCQLVAWDGTLNASRSASVEMDIP